jgi:hypothetical protein
MLLDVLDLERYMKKLNGFVRKREKPEGFMVEGYIVYESYYYANDYINQIDETLGAVFWDDQWDEDKREGDVLQANGKKVLDKE